MFKPRIYYRFGWWRVELHPKKWKNRSEIERGWWNLAYAYVAKLNEEPMSIQMREAYYEYKANLYVEPSLEATEEWFRSVCND